MLLALVKKEIRQNAVITVVAFFFSILVFENLLISGGGGNWLLSGRTIEPDPTPLLSNREVGVSVFYLLFGLLLGFSGITEIGSDKSTWPLLLRLPVSRGTILLGKILGGTASYLLVGLPPLLIVVVWVAIPGHYPGPFRIGMAAPLLVDLVIGLMAFALTLGFGVNLKNKLIESGNKTVPKELLLILLTAPALLTFAIVYHDIDDPWMAALLAMGTAAMLLCAAYSFFETREF